MEIKEIQDLIKLVNKSSLTEVEIEQKDFKLKIKRKSPDNKVVYNTSGPPSGNMQMPTPPAPPSPPSEAQSPASADKSEEAEELSNVVEFKSPMIGTFYRASGPDKPVFAKVGDTVRKGDVLCIIEAMKLFNEIESEVDGKIVKIMLDDAQPVEYDQVLFLIEPTA